MRKMFLRVQISTRASINLGREQYLNLIVRTVCGVFDITVAVVKEFDVRSSLTVQPCRTSS
jgi:hypothetical protein